MTRQWRTPMAFFGSMDWKSALLPRLPWHPFLFLLALCCPSCNVFPPPRPADFLPSEFFDQSSQPEISPPSPPRSWCCYPGRSEIRDLFLLGHAGLQAPARVTPVQPHLRFCVSAIAHMFFNVAF
ncbi:hypothetical protein C8R45DRAFT_972242 [Mycena sanguinolenta]|nr:hypothetical protein C8R45DRAFT_972242 [Mycena sanguinolenta]